MGAKSSKNVGIGLLYGYKLFPGQKMIWLISKQVILWILIQCTLLQHCGTVVLCHTELFYKTVLNFVQLYPWGFAHIITKSPDNLNCLWNHSLMFYQWLVCKRLCDYSSSEHQGALKESSKNDCLLINQIIFFHGNSFYP